MYTAKRLLIVFALALLSACAHVEAIKRIVYPAATEKQPTYFQYEERPAQIRPPTVIERQSPKVRAPAPVKDSRSGAVCRDGSTSTATGRGACSHHGGVSYWR